MKTSVRLLCIGLGFAVLPFVCPRAVATTVDGVEPSTGHLWSAIKGDTYEQRAHFAEGANRLAAKLDEQIRALRAKRAAMTTDITDWDFAMKAVDESRALLTSRMEELLKATTPETWADAKDKIDEAWHRSQLAVDNMNSTRTS